MPSYDFMLLTSTFLLDHHDELNKKKSHTDISCAALITQLLVSPRLKTVSIAVRLLASLSAFNLDSEHQYSIVTHNPKP
jgi:hypothetical protein